MTPPALIVLNDSNILLLDSLVKEAKDEGRQFVQRTIDDWHSGANRFDMAGEQLWGLASGATLIGIGGLNSDPYTEKSATGGYSGRLDRAIPCALERRVAYPTKKSAINNQ